MVNYLQKICRVLLIIFVVLLTILIPLLAMSFWLLWADRNLSDPQLAVRVLETIFSWPIAILIIGLVLLHHYKEPLGKLIERLKSFKTPGGAMADFAKSTEDRQRKNIEELKIETDEKYKKFWIFEKIWNAIWSTQILLLEDLSASGQPMNVQEVEGYFHIHIQKQLEMDPGEKEAYDNPISYKNLLRSYVGFLKSNNLVEEKEDSFSGTQSSREFLAYMKSQGYFRDGRIF